MSSGTQVASLIEGYLERVFEEYEGAISEEGAGEFVSTVVNQVVVIHGVSSLSADYVADEARAYAREYERELDWRV